MRQEVELLLAEHDKAGSYIDKPLVGSVVSLLNQAVPELNGNSLLDGRKIGQAIGHYQILDKLGEGGMGVVYKARDSRLERFVAIKMMRLAKLADAERKQRFLQEAKSASALNHPNIITIYDTNREYEIDYMVMEYIAGKTLDQLIPPTGLDLNEALCYALQISEALISAHAVGIVHRDLKPSNVMVSERGLVKVLDFGLAKLAEQADRGVSYRVPSPRTNGGPYTQEGEILGTDAYMSPEQSEGKKTDTRSDIFSFGSVLYEMVTGQKAFRGDSKTSTRVAIIKKDPKPICEISTAFPPDLEKIINRCLEKSPDARWQTVEELRGALQAVEETIEAGSRTRLKFADRMTWRSWLWAGAAMVLLASITAMWLFRNSPRRPATIPEVIPLTTYVGWEVSPSFSPDEFVAS